MILLHVPLKGDTINPVLTAFQEMKWMFLRSHFFPIAMENLLAAHENDPVCYASEESHDSAFILHTSGTTKGTRKMLPFTDKVFNDSLNMMPEGHHSLIEDPDKYKPLRLIQLFDMSSVMALAGMIHGPLAHGDTLVMTFFGFMHPKFVRAIDYYDVSVLMGTGFMYDKWLDRDDLDDVDFSSLRIVSLSGGFVSPEKMEKYQKFFADHGFRYQIMNAYDMSEAGGKHIFGHPGHGAGHPHGEGHPGGHPHGEGHPGGHPHAAEQVQDTLGHVEDPENYRIKDENDGKFYRLEDGPRTGLLYKYSETRPSNELDGVILYEYTEIDGKDFLCTNDLMRVNEDGSLSFAGRADKYFVNNEGRKFDSGIVDMQLSAQSAVDRCAVVPVMDKRIHDTVPVLYVVPAEKGPKAAESIRQAFVDVYVKNKSIPAENLPSQFMIVNDIPLNPNGKLDIYRITRERLEGDAWNLIPVMDKDQLTDIRTEHREHVNSMTGGTLPHGMENNSAYNVFDFFTGGSGENTDDPITRTLEFLKRKDMKPWDLFNPFMHYKLLMPDDPEKKLKMPEIPQNVRKAGLKYVNRIAGIPYGRKSIDVDFEED